MLRFSIRRLAALALLPVLATCSETNRDPAAEALTAAQAREEARLIAFLLDGADSLRR